MHEDYQPFIIGTLAQAPHFAASISSMANAYTSHKKRALPPERRLLSAAARVLMNKHGVIVRLSNGHFQLCAQLTLSQRDEIVRLCNSKIEEYHSTH